MQEQSPGQMAIFFLELQDNFGLSVLNIQLSKVFFQPSLNRIFHSIERSSSFLNYPSEVKNTSISPLISTIKSPQSLFSNSLLSRNIYLEKYHSHPYFSKYLSTWICIPVDTIFILMRVDMILFLSTRNNTKQHEIEFQLNFPEDHRP